MNLRTGERARKLFYMLTAGQHLLLVIHVFIVCNSACDIVTLQDEHSDSGDEELALDQDDEALEDDEEELLKQSEKMKRQM